MRLIGAIVAFIFVATAAHGQQSFQCRLGTSPACLGYTDKVCDGIRGKCIDSGAICFDEYACGIGTTASDFICKKKAKALVDDLEIEFKKLQLAYDLALDCVAKARSLREAQRCN